MGQNSTLLPEEINIDTPLSDSPQLHQWSSLPPRRLCRVISSSINEVCYACKVEHCRCICDNLCYAAHSVCFFSTTNDSLWTINLLHAYPFSAGAAGSIIFSSLLTMTTTHLSPSSQQLLIFSSRLTEWRRQSQKGQTASPRQSAPRKSTSSHRWDKLLGISHEVTLGWFLLHDLQSHCKECSLCLLIE